jgi:hypothetical protein
VHGDEGRWRLLVVESKRDGSGGVLREHVLVDLGTVEVTVLNPNQVPRQLAAEYRTASVTLSWPGAGERECFWTSRERRRGIGPGTFGSSA